jgi:hypothetical protein
MQLRRFYLQASMSQRHGSLQITLPLSEELRIRNSCRLLFVSGGDFCFIIIIWIKKSGDSVKPGIFSSS